jgi:hypothetical protein
MLTHKLLIQTVEHAAGKRDMLAQKLTDARKDVAKIKAQLGEEETTTDEQQV